MLPVSYSIKYSTEREIGAQPSMQSAPKVIRGPLCHGLCHDIDMENCHMMIVLSVVGLHGISVPAVKAYVDNRSEVIGQAREHYQCSRKAANELFLRLLNGGREDMWLKADLSTPRVGCTFRPRAL